MLSGQRLRIVLGEEQDSYLLGNMELIEEGLQEALVATRNALRQVQKDQYDYSFEGYADVLRALTGNLKTITETYLAIKGVKAARV